MPVDAHNEGQEGLQTNGRLFPSFVIRMDPGPYPHDSRKLRIRILLVILMRNQLRILHFTSMLIQIWILVSKPCKGVLLRRLFFAAQQRIAITLSPNYYKKIQCFTTRKNQEEHGPDVM